MVLAGWARVLAPVNGHPPPIAAVPLRLVSDEMDAWLGSVTELRAVIPVAAEHPAVGGGRVFVTSVELWADAVRWHVSQIPPPSIRIRSPDYKMSDDLGTTYDLANDGARTDIRLFNQHLIFTPCAAEAARSLRLSGGGLRPGQQVEVELPG